MFDYWFLEITFLYTVGSNLRLEIMSNVVCVTSKKQSKLTIMGIIFV